MQNKVRYKKCINCGHTYAELQMYGKYCEWCHNSINKIDVFATAVKYKTEFDRACSVCGNQYTQRWYKIDNNIICFKCYKGQQRLMGVLNPNSQVGMGVITEHITAEVLGNCTKCNIKGNFNAPYDLISEKYGTINVKSSKLYVNNKWGFRKRENSSVPDYYICIGFDWNKHNILHVWFIPSELQLFNKNGLYINTTALNLYNVYEVPPEPYNNIYKNLDIYSLPEFRNYNKQIIHIK